MPALTNIRYETFVREYLRTANKAQAYVKAFGIRMQPHCAWSAGSRLFNRPVVQKRLKELQMEISKKHDITIEKVLRDFQEAIDMAREQGNPANIIAGAKEQARLVGLLVERREVGSVGDFENLNSMSELLRAVEAEVGPEAAKVLAKALDVTKEAEAEALLEAEAGSDAVN